MYSGWGWNVREKMLKETKPWSGWYRRLQFKIRSSFLSVVRELKKKGIYFTVEMRRLLAVLQISRAFFARPSSIPFAVLLFPSRPHCPGPLAENPGWKSSWIEDSRLCSLSICCFQDYSELELVNAVLSGEERESQGYVDFVRFATDAKAIRRFARYHWSDRWSKKLLPKISRNSIKSFLNKL